MRRYNLYFETLFEQLNTFLKYASSGKRKTGFVNLFVWVKWVYRNGSICCMMQNLR